MERLKKYGKNTNKIFFLTRITITEKPLMVPVPSPYANIYNKINVCYRQFYILKSLVTIFCHLVITPNTQYLNNTSCKSYIQQTGYGQP